jgi:hypothetical protein
LRKEKKLGRKREREEALILEKRRKDEEKNVKVIHQNGEDDLPPRDRDKHHHTRVSLFFGRLDG